MKWFYPLLLLLPSALKAHPVSFQDAISWVSYNQGSETSQLLNYTFTANTAIGVHFVRMRGEKYFFPQLNARVKRWNTDNSQANIYLGGGIGGVKHEEHSSTAAVLETSADWETRRLFTSISYMGLTSPELHDMDIKRARVGIAPYIAEFNKLHTWIMIELRQQDRLKPWTTPLIRMFYKEILWEIGSSLDGELMFNFMFHW